MTDPLTMTIPSPPSANRYWRHVGTRVLLSAEARAYREKVASVATTARIRAIPADSRCVVTLRWFRARKSGDLDNRIKQALDALRGVAYHDDGQVVELHAYRAEDPSNPRMEVHITTLTEAA